MERFFFSCRLSSKVPREMVVKIEFLSRVRAGDPLERPCTILGSNTNLKCVSFDKVSPYLGDRVTAKVSHRY